MYHDISSLQTRLAALNANLKHTLQLVQQLSRLQPADPTVAQTTSQPVDDETRADLTTSIHEQLRNAEDDLELLRQDAVDLDQERPQAGGQRSRRSTLSGRNAESSVELARCIAGCEKLDEDLKLTRTRFRRAQLTAKANADRAVQREKTRYLSSLQAAAAASANNPASSTEQGSATSNDQEQKPMYTDLFAGRRPRPSPTSTSAVQDDILLTSQSDITSSLRRTQNLMQSELSRSQFANETLQASNEALKELNQRYDTFDDLISKSRGLLGTLLRSQKSDTWYLETSCWLLVGVIAWLIFRRWIYGPFWWFFWMPVKLLWNLVWGLGYVLGVAGKTKGTQTTDLGGTTVIGSAESIPTATVSRDGPSIGTSSLTEPSTTARSPPGSLSEALGTMIDSSTSLIPSATENSDRHVVQDEKSSQNETERLREPRRGDGQVLPKRDEATQPRNPKKRMMEEPQEDEREHGDPEPQRKSEP